MQKKVLSSIGLVFVVNILIKPLWILVIDRGVQNTLGYEAYGEYAGMFSISIILTMLLDFGINNYNSSTIANNPESVTKQFSELVSNRCIGLKSDTCSLQHVSAQFGKRTSAFQNRCLIIGC
jgi:O-antigen/teichoic acid export membrane protein